MAESQRICFISIEAFATLKPGVARVAGGAGFQVVGIGRRLRELGHHVSFIVGDFGQPFYEVVDGFPTYRASRISAKNRLTRGPANLVRLFFAMRAAKADHYVLRSIRPLSFFILVFARLLGARYVFMVASLPHVTKEEREGMPGILKVLYAWSLKHADRVTVQSEEQRRHLWDNFRVTGSLVPNGIALPAVLAQQGNVSHDVVWIQTIKPIKCPELLIEIAQALPHRRFLVAGGPGDHLPFFEDTARRFESQPNIDYAGFVPPDEVANYFRKGKLFLLTSLYEGFPNTFLHAWAQGVPVCSVGIDPDGVVNDFNLGIVHHDFRQLAVKMDALLTDEHTYSIMRANCWNYVNQNHSLELAGDSFLGALDQSQKQEATQ